MHPEETKKTAPRRRSPRGVSLAEILVVVALAGIAALAAVANWPAYKFRSEISSAARMTEVAIHQARMYSVYRGVRHFVVLDTAASTVSIHVDSNGNAVFDGADTDLSVKVSHWPAIVRMELPPSSAALPDPTFPDTREVVSAWDLPEPDSDGVWGETLFGIMTTPTGQVMSTEAVPQRINGGTVVFSGGRKGMAASVSLRGGGMLKSFWFLDASWRTL